MTFDVGAAQHVIQAFIGERNAVLIDLVVEPLSSPLPLHAPYFKDVGEIRPNRNTEGNYDLLQPIIHELEFFIAGALPEKFRPQQVQRVARNRNRVAMVNVYIGQIGAQDKVIRFDRGTEQQRTRVPQINDELGKIARTAEEDALFAQAKRFDVAITIKDRKRLPVLENPGTVVGRRRPGGYVVLLGDVNFIQFRTPSDTAGGSVTSR